MPLTLFVVTIPEQTVGTHKVRGRVEVECPQIEFHDDDDRAREAGRRFASAIESALNRLDIDTE